jgi:hypothetical protein
MSSSDSDSDVFITQHRFKQCADNSDVLVDVLNLEECFNIGVQKQLYSDISDASDLEPAMDKVVDITHKPDIDRLRRKQKVHGLYMYLLHGKNNEMTRYTCY